MKKGGILNCVLAIYSSREPFSAGAD